MLYYIRYIRGRILKFKSNNIRNSSLFQLYIMLMNMHDISPKASGYRKMKACIRMSDVQKLKIIHYQERPEYKREYLLGIADTPFLVGKYLLLIMVGL